MTIHLSIVKHMHWLYYSLFTKIDSFNQSIHLLSLPGVPSTYSLHEDLSTSDRSVETVCVNLSVLVQYKHVNYQLFMAEIS